MSGRTLFCDICGTFFPSMYLYVVHVAHHPLYSQSQSSGLEAVVPAAAAAPPPPPFPPPSVAYDRGALAAPLAPLSHVRPLGLGGAGDHGLVAVATAVPAGRGIAGGGGIVAAAAASSAVPGADSGARGSGDAGGAAVGHVGGGGAHGGGGSGGGVERGRVGVETGVHADDGALIVGALHRDENLGRSGGVVAAGTAVSAGAGARPDCGALPSGDGEHAPSSPLSSGSSSSSSSTTVPGTARGTSRGRDVNVPHGLDEVHGDRSIPSSSDHGGGANGPGVLVAGATGGMGPELLTDPPLGHVPMAPVPSGGMDDLGVLEPAPKEFRVRRVGGERPYQCHECGRLFAHLQNAIRHVRRHDKSIMCDVCGKFFSQKSDLVRHLKSHSQERPYVCDECGRAFLLAQGLRQHVRIHSEEKKPVPCTICGLTFCRPSALQKHHVRFHVHDCSVCTMRFETNALLEAHMESVHDEARDKFQCPECGKLFTRRASVVMHQQHEHPAGAVSSSAAAAVATVAATATVAAAAAEAAASPTSAAAASTAADTSYMCLLCNHRLKTNDEMEAHVREHRGSKPYECTACGRGYTRRANMLAHYEREHRDLRPGPVLVTARRDLQSLAVGGDAVIFRQVTSHVPGGQAKGGDGLGASEHHASVGAGHLQHGVDHGDLHGVALTGPDPIGPPAPLPLGDPE